MSDGSIATREQPAPWSTAFAEHPLLNPECAINQPMVSLWAGGPGCGHQRVRELPWGGPCTEEASEGAASSHPSCSRASSAGCCVIASAWCLLWFVLKKSERKELEGRPRGGLPVGISTNLVPIRGLGSSGPPVCLWSSLTKTAFLGSCFLRKMQFGKGGKNRVLQSAGSEHQPVLSTCEGQGPAQVCAADALEAPRRCWPP